MGFANGLHLFLRGTLAGLALCLPVGALSFAERLDCLCLFCGQLQLGKGTLTSLRTVTSLAAPSAFATPVPLAFGTLRAIGPELFELCDLFVGQDLGDGGLAGFADGFPFLLRGTLAGFALCLPVGLLCFSEGLERFGLFVGQFERGERTFSGTSLTPSLELLGLFTDLTLHAATSAAAAAALRFGQAGETDAQGQDSDKGVTCFHDAFLLQE
jgi:hypothetical protein